MRLAYAIYTWGRDWRGMRRRPRIKRALRVKLAVMILLPVVRNISITLARALHKAWREDPRRWA